MPPPAGHHADPFSMAGKPLPTSLDAGVPLRDVQEAASHADPRTTMRDDRARRSLDRYATYSSPPMSRAPPGKSRTSGGRLRPAATAGRSKPGIDSRKGDHAQPPQREREPFCTGMIPSVRSAGGAQNGIFCRLGYLLANARRSSAARNCSAWARRVRQWSAGPLRQFSATDPG
jgi:hypothetical protein